MLKATAKLACTQAYGMSLLSNAFNAQLEDSLIQEGLVAFALHRLLSLMPTIIVWLAVLNGTRQRSLANHAITIKFGAQP